MTSPRVLFWDLETTDLQADFGNVLAAGYMWADEAKPRVISLLDTNEHCAKCGRVDAVDDRPLIEEFQAVLAEADMWVTWFGKGFDAKVMNTRILDAKLKPLPPVPHVDLYFAAKHHLKLSSNRLASVQDFLRLPTSKTPITKRVWRRAQAGDVPSIRYVVDHCRKDVMVLAEAYEKLKPYVRQHPRLHIGVDGACQSCGGTRLQRRGKVITKSRGPLVRAMCKDCGTWGYVA